MSGTNPAPADPREEAASARRERARAILEVLARRHPEVRVPLRHRTPLQLLVSTILSAQCTDAMVNRVTPVLFERWPDAAALAGADRAELEHAIRPTGFFRQKARMVQETARAALTRFGGEPPRRMEDLLTLPGVGRKTANVLLSAARIEGWPGWGAPGDDGMGIVVDTHVLRLSRRLGLTLRKDPAGAERDLIALVPKDEWALLPLRLIAFGREICTARRPACGDCPLLPWCPAGPLGGATPWVQRLRDSRGRPPRGRASGTPRRTRRSRRTGPSR